MNKSAKVLIIILSIAVFIVVTPLIVSFFYPGTEICCSHIMVDTKAGRIREEKYFWYINVGSEIKPTEITSAAFPEGEELPRPKWEKCLTFSPMVRKSPNYPFRGTLNIFRTLNLIFAAQGDKMTADEKKKLSQNVLTLLQESDSDINAQKYLDAYLLTLDNL